jgi:uncharacterized protein
MSTMQLSKYQIKQAIVEAIKGDAAIHKIIIFGSFLKSDTPNDIDVAVVGEFKQGYLDAAIQLRQHVRQIAKILPVDIVPIQENAPPNSFVQDIFDGEVIYEA